MMDKGTRQADGQSSALMMLLRAIASRDQQKVSEGARSLAAALPTRPDESLAKWLSKHLPRRTKGRLSANWLFGAYARVGAIGDRIFHSTGVFRVACCCGSHDQGMITSKLEGVAAVSFLPPETTANHRSAPTK